MAAARFVLASDDLLALIDSKEDAQAFAHCRARLVDLRGMVQDLFDLDMSAGSKAKRTNAESKLHRALAYQKKARRDVEEKLATLRNEKVQGSLRPESIVRVALSSPNLNRRELAGVFSSVGLRAVSASSITKIRDAFVETLKLCCKRQVQAMVEAGSVSAQGVIEQPLFIHHLHDEALMRYRSYDRVELGGSSSSLHRGRYSKVQNNAVTISMGASTQAAEWFVELQPLSRKDGPTLASAISAAVQPILDVAAEGAGVNHARRVKIVHMLIGDGINTNENAAKRMLHKLAFSDQAPGHLQYRLLLWKCSSHQSNLVVLVAIAGELINDAVDKNELCATLSRLYKYLAPSYLEEFTARLRDLVTDTFRLRYDIDSLEVQGCQAHTKKLQALYGDGVLPSELCALRNGNLATMEHVAGLSCEAERARKDMFDVLLKLVWFIEEKLVVTRFFLFTPCCFALLRMLLLGLPVSLFSVGALRAEAEQSKRLSAVRAFYSNPGTPVLLRRACLALRLTLFATSLTAQKGTSAGGKEPMMVRLGRREVQLRTSALLADIVPRLPDDPQVDQKGTLHALLLTQAHIVMRFDMYSRFPTRLFVLTKKYNSTGYLVEIVDFLSMDDRLLDGGYSLLLKREAWERGGQVEARAVDYLRSDNVQSELVAVLERASASSLDIERKHQQDKQSETTKVTGCAAASRDACLRRYLIRQKAAAARTAEVQTRTLAAARLNIRALAIQQRPELLSQGRGQLRWQGEVDETTRRSVRKQGNEAELAAYIEQHQEDLKAELARRRAAARIEDAAATLLPLTSDSWLQYLDEHEHEFRDLMRVASQQRRVLSERIQASDDVTGEARVYPAPCREHGHSPLWSHLPPGFLCFVVGQHKLVCFVATLGHTVYAAPLNSTVVGREYDLFLQTPFCDLLRPLALVLDQAQIPDDRSTDVYSLEVSPVRFSSDRVTLRILEATPVPFRQPAARASSSKEVEQEKDFGEAEYAEMCAKLDTIGEAESDLESLCSSSEEDTDTEEEQESEASEEDEGGARMPKGTHVVSDNRYFTLIDNRNFSDCVMQIKKRWCKEEELGVSNMSKRFVTSKFGDERSEPTRTKLVLRAWMLWRARQNDWCYQRAARRKPSPTSSRP